jgi:hypothetical protein
LVYFAARLVQDRTLARPDLASSLRASAIDGHHFRPGRILRHITLEPTLSARFTKFMAVAVPGLPDLREEILISIPAED